MTGELIYNLINDLFMITRSLTGEGVRDTLAKIKKEHLMNLTIYEIGTGVEVNDWIIPKEWNINSAFIKNSCGKKVIDLRNNNLHVVGYSKPVNKIMSLSELNNHLYSLPDKPDAIPYVTSYYKEDWGFCLSENQRMNLDEKKYHVVIDSTLKNGSLTYADLKIPGQQSEEVFFSTYICHPSMANNELSGPGVATYIAKYLSARENRYTYRFVFAPETIGSIVYLSKNIEELKMNVVASFNLTCVGDDKTLSFMPSRKGNTYTDKVARHVLENQEQAFISYSFMKDRGSDERQYCAPGVDLPMVSIMKSKYGEYPEYHTSLDNMDFISSEGLGSSYRIHLECINIIENNYYYKSTCIGELFLSKRGKNYMVVGGKENKSSISAKRILDVMACCDGENDIIDIAELLGVYAGDLIEVFEELNKDGLLVKEDCRGL